MYIAIILYCGPFKANYLHMPLSTTHLFWTHVLSFLLGATGQTGAYFGPGSGPIHLDYVVCSGTEYNFTDCQVGKGTTQSSHSEDVGVKCQTSKNNG